MSKDPSLVVYDDLGGGVGQTIGYVEGREAAQPFEQPTPVDAINAALVDEMFYSPTDPCLNLTPMKNKSSALETWKRWCATARTFGSCPTTPF